MRRTTALLCAFFCALVAASALSACGVRDTEVSTSGVLASAKPTEDPKTVLRLQVQAYANDMLTGDIRAYDDYFASSCKAKISRSQFRIPLTWAKDAYGKARPIETFEAEINGTYADVSYTFGPRALDQDHEIWVLQRGKWLTTDCS